MLLSRVMIMLNFVLVRCMKMVTELPRMKTKLCAGIGRLLRIKVAEEVVWPDTDLSSEKYNMVDFRAMDHNGLFLETRLSLNEESGADISRPSLLMCEEMVNNTLELKIRKLNKVRKDARLSTISMGKKTIGSSAMIINGCAVTGSVSFRPRKERSITFVRSNILYVDFGWWRSDYRSG